MQLSYIGRGVALAVAFLCSPWVHAGPDTQVPVTSLGAPAPTQATRGLAQRILAVADHAGLPFAIVDKRAAMLAVYLGDGRLSGVTPVLLGQAPGDHVVPGVGQRAQLGRLRADDLTTPAGRFASEPGHNRSGEAVVWIDYDSALAIHRVRPGPSRQSRLNRLASSRARDRRVSAGCVVVPLAFYDAVIHPVLGRAPGVVYVMAEDGLAPSMSQALADSSH